MTTDRTDTPADDPVPDGIVSTAPAEAALADEPAGPDTQAPDTPPADDAEGADLGNLPVGLATREDQVDFHGERLALALRLAHRAARDICRVAKGHRCTRKG